MLLNIDCISTIAQYSKKADKFNIMTTCKHLFETYLSSHKFTFYIDRFLQLTYINDEFNKWYHYIKDVKVIGHYGHDFILYYMKNLEYCEISITKCSISCSCFYYQNSWHNRPMTNFNIPSKININKLKITNESANLIILFINKKTLIKNLKLMGKIIFSKNMIGSIQNLKIDLFQVVYNIELPNSVKYVIIKDVCNKDMPSIGDNIIKFKCSLNKYITNYKKISETKIEHLIVTTKSNENQLIDELRNVISNKIFLPKTLIKIDIEYTDFNYNGEYINKNCIKNKYETLMQL